MTAQGRFGLNMRAGRKKVGIKENLIRYSCGIEGVEDLWADLEEALDRA